MRKLLGIVLALALLLTSTAAFAQAYEGAGQGNGGEIKVAVTVEDGKITDIQVVDHSETAGLSDPAFESIPAAVIANQSLAVDTVSGATNTSNGLLAAIEAACAAAGLDVEALKAAEVAQEEVTYDSELTADVIVVGAAAQACLRPRRLSRTGPRLSSSKRCPPSRQLIIICGGIYNTPDEELQKNVEMTDSVRSLVEDAWRRSPSAKSTPSSSKR